jgi:hypothetical protein
MKTSIKYTRWLAVAALTVAWFPAMAVAAIHVKLAVNGNTSLYVTENDAQCPDGPLDCVEVAKGSSPNLFFELDNACMAGGPEYGLQQIRIAMAAKDWPTSSNPLPQYAVDDFNADPESGVIDLVPGTDNENAQRDNMIKFKDKNSRAYTVYYEITARQCNGGGTIVLDPSVRNGGK